MENKVVFAAAGHGKTYSICAKAKEALQHSNKCVLLLSYTNEGLHALENEYKKQNYGVMDARIVIKSWYSFLMSEFIKPYQCLLQLKEKVYKKEFDAVIPENYITSIAFYDNEQPPRWFNQTHLKYFINNHGDVVSDRVSHLAFLSNQQTNGKPIARMGHIYSHVFIDELQDYAGWDLEIIRLLFSSDVVATCVGDYKQATYRTNNSNKNKQYRDEHIRKYFSELQKKGLCCISYENTTRRFNQEICDFINTIHNDAESQVIVSETSGHEMPARDTGVYIIENQYLDDYIRAYHPVVLRYDKRAKICFNSEGEVYNYGGSKGATFDRVVIIPVATVMPFLDQQTPIAKEQTRAKFYVACTRAKHSVVFATDNSIANKNFVESEIILDQRHIPVRKFVLGT